MANLVQPDPSDRWTQAVLKLTKLTRDGKITWAKVATPVKTTEAEAEAFQASYDNQRLLLRRSVSPLALIIGFEKGAHIYSLEIIDQHGGALWTFPRVQALADLYQAVAYYQAGVGAFIDRLLAP